MGTALDLQAMTRGNLHLYRWHRSEARRHLRSRRELMANGSRDNLARAYEQKALAHLADARALRTL